MQRTTTLLSIFILVLGICIPTALTHTPWGPCATIYTELNLQGNSAQICASGWLSNDFNNKVSSIKIPTGFSMRLFRDGNLQGEFIDITAGTWNASTAWDDQISSVQYNNWENGCATLYSENKYLGTQTLICNNANLIPGFNDQVGSLYVRPNHFFRLYKGIDYTGDWLDVRGSLNLVSWANQVKSMKLKHWSYCTWLHTGKNGSGTYFQVCDTGSLPTSTAKQASSITVPEGMYVTVYKTFDYTGESKRLNPGFQNLDDDWDNVVASVKVVITAELD